MNVAAPGASVPRRSVARRAALFGWLALAFVVAATIEPAMAQGQSSVILNLRGDETPETIRKMVDALSAPGRQVEIRVGGVPTAPGPAMAPATAPKAEAPKPSMADEDLVNALAQYVVNNTERI